jgi:hypothetical protein
LEPALDFKLDQSSYPQPKILFLKPIKERVPVFEGNFRITQDVTINADRSFIQSLGQGKTVSIKGDLKYQACDKTTCYVPSSVPVSWDIQVLPLDRQRSPEAIQHH